MKQRDGGVSYVESVEDGPVRSSRGREEPPGAQRVAGGMIAGAALTPKAVAVVLLPALVLMLAFAFSYVGAFHEPIPHNVPTAVVGPPSVATHLDQLPGAPLDTRVAPSRADALAQIDDRKVYGAFDVATNRLYVASAANRATAIALERTFDRVAAAQGRPAVRVTDVKPLPPKDPNGTAAFYAVIAWVFGGYIGATLIGLIGTPRSRSHARAAARTGALAGFGVVAGILSVLLLRVCFGVFAGHVAALCAIAALTIFASGAATAGIQAAAGPAGTGLVILLFVILGNPASGGPFARTLLPGLWRTIGGVLPPGASVDLARSALFFDGARIAGPILVLVGWTALGTALVIALGGRTVSMVEAETEAAAGAAL
ncbi:MAG: ABC transporter permease [Solirubrobacteraceae bacterium]